MTYRRNQRRKRIQAGSVWPGKREVSAGGSAADGTRALMFARRIAPGLPTGSKPRRR